MMRTAIAAPSQVTLGTSPLAVPAPVAAQRPETLVVVQRDWNGWRKAMTPLSMLEDIHWHQPKGAPRPLIHAFVQCDAFVSGNLPHECHEAAGPHRLLVCVLKSHTAPTVFAGLVDRANRAKSMS